MRFFLASIWAITCSISFYAGKVSVPETMNSRGPASAAVNEVVGQKIPVILGAGKGLIFISKVDTGAETSSLHAVDIKVRWETENNKKVPYVSFTTVDDDNKKIKFDRRVSRIDDVKNANGKMIRYYIEENVRLLDKDITTEISLTDRSDLTFKFLLGKNTLKSLNLVVDTSKDIIVYENSSPRYVYRP